MTVQPINKKNTKGKGPFRALCGLFVIGDRSSKKTSKSTNDDLLPATKAEWVDSERHKNPKVTPKDTLKTTYKRKSFFPSVFERRIRTLTCPCCANEIQAYFQQRNGALFNKYVDKSGGKQAVRVATDYDQKKWHSLGYTKWLPLGKEHAYDTCYKKHLATIYCQKCRKAVTHEYLKIYLQEKTGAYNVWASSEYVKENN